MPYRQARRVEFATVDTFNLFADGLRSEAYAWFKRELLQEFDGVLRMVPVDKHKEIHDKASDLWMAFIRELAWRAEETPVTQI